MKRIFRIMLLVAAITIFSITGASIAYADSPLTLSLPVEIAVSGDAQETDELFTIQVEATDANCPMPEGSAGTTYTKVFTESGAQTIPPISFSELGVYNYTISQIEGNNSNYEFDDTVYILTVYITSTEDHEGLEMTAVLSPDAGSLKQTTAVFNNVYVGETTPSPDPSSSSSSVDNPSNPGSNPKTGDTTPVLMYAVVFLAGSIAMISMYIAQRKHRKKQCE